MVKLASELRRVRSSKNPKVKRNMTSAKLEMEYELHQHTVNYQESVKPLLPIKTKGGKLISRQSCLQPAEVCHESDDNPGNDVSAPAKCAEIGFTDMLLKREEIIERQKFLIGVTCASIQENPDTKIEKLAVVMDLISDRSQNDEKNVLVIRKLALISVAELFKDIIPEYKLGILDASVHKMKKTTITRVNFENKLLKHFQCYLVHCESFAKSLIKATKNVPSEEFQLAETSVQCLCDLLVAHPYFNYSMNIGQILATLLNSDVSSVRKCVYDCFVTIFKADNRFDLSLHIVRSINRVVKKNGINVHPETISCLKYLPIAGSDIDSETAREKKLKKLETHKSRVINLSKKERKRKKKLMQLENELFETRADESKMLLTKKKSDLTKLVFTILFRVLKVTPVSKLLSAALEILSRFAHAINIDFFADLVEILNSLLNSEKLGYREELHCIQAVFAILKGQGEIMNIDPVRFYSHLYKNLLTIHAGNNHEDFPAILSTLDSVLLNRRRDITYQRYLAFVKRISIMTLQLLHFGSLGCLGVIKSAMTLNSTLDVILDTETYIGSGNYNPELNEPDYSCANCSNLYELSALHRHYHPCVRRFSIHIANGTPSTGPGSLPVELAKMSAIELYNNFDCSKMVFNPSIPCPKISVK